jgi:hypothetical protein
MAIASAHASGATTGPKYSQLLYPSASSGIMNIWITSHKHAATPTASLIISLGVSYADQMVSLWGPLTRAMMTTSAQEIMREEQ